MAARYGIGHGKAHNYTKQPVRESFTIAEIKTLVPRFNKVHAVLAVSIPALLISEIVFLDTTISIIRCTCILCQKYLFLVETRALDDNW